MKNMAATDQMAAEKLSAYASSWEHLSDELRRLDLIIRLRLLAHGGKQPSSPLDQFRGLVVTENEIAGLLDEAAADSDGGKGQALIAALREIDFIIETRKSASAENGVHLSLPHLARSFQLTDFEQRCLIICLAPELDRKYEKLYAYLQDDVTRKKPTIALAMDLFLGNREQKIAARWYFDQRAPLLKYRILQVNDDSPEGAAPLISRSLKLDDRMVAFLLGATHIDSRIEQMARLSSGEAESQHNLPAEATQSWALSLVRSHFAVGSSREPLTFYFYGPYGSGKRPLAEMISGELGLGLIVGDVGGMLNGPLAFEDALWLIAREALLQHAALCLENIDRLLGEDDISKWRLKQVIEVSLYGSLLTFLFGSQPWKPQELSSQTLFVELHLPVPDDKARRTLWERMSSDYPIAEDVDLGAVASKFRFTQGQIRDALNWAKTLTRVSSRDGGKVTMATLYESCRAQSSHRLNSLARKVEPFYTWDDLVLPGDVKEQLREMCRRVVYRHRVMGDWGFGDKLSLGKGVNALFAGPSGTGKTMGTSIIARELGLDLYKIDLSGVVSKYIGETEKNLDRVFTAAEDANAILFFDEADALFGKRSEVRDSHDRYANIEISYLLQKMEEYEGLSILATNLKANLDESFTRRLAFTIHFPYPDEESRRSIWQGIWPQQIELDESVDLDFLANRFKLSGGNIKNIALAAAFLAADENGPVSMKHLIHATRREYQKLGKPSSADELMSKAVN